MAQILLLRQVKAEQAEVHAVTAARALADSEAAADRAEAELTATAVNWRDSLAEGGLASGTTRLWSRALLRQEDVVAERRHAQREAQATEIDAARAWRNALLERDVAEELLDMARGREAQRRQERTQVAIDERQQAQWWRARR
jgi:hypothetical protein